MRYLLIPLAFILGAIMVGYTRDTHAVNHVFTRIPPSKPTDWAPRFRRWENGSEVSRERPVS